MLSAEGHAGPPSAIALKEYLEQRYLPWAEGRLRRTTMAGYRSVVRIHVVPRLGSLRLSKVTPHVIDMWVARMLREKVKDQTRNHAYVVLRTALRQAVAWGMLPSDPTVGTRAPNVPERDLVTLDIDQANRYLDAFAGTACELAVVIALGVGLRRSEACALQWSDLKLVAPTGDAPASGAVTITKARHQYGREVWTTEPKSKSSRRALLLAPWVVEALLPHRGLGPVVSMAPDELTRAYRKTIKTFNAEHTKTPLPYVPFRDLRNAHGSIMVDLGEGTKAIADYYGHETSEVTERRYIRPHLAVQERYVATVQRMRHSPQSPATEGDERVSAGTE